MAVLLKVKTWYLEMLQKPEITDFPANENFVVMRAEKPDVAFYRYLYHRAGGDWLWVDRKLMSDSELEKIITSSQNEIYVLYFKGTPAGYGEIFLHTLQDIEVLYFGIFPEFIGKKFGSYLMQFILQKAWEREPKRVWLHTCENDHPGAIHFYQKNGFQIYNETIINQIVPE